jgi:predicted RNase H-like HicB family nuclease
MEKEIQIKAFWDSEAKAWVAQSSDVPGLVTEAETMEQLIAKLQTMIPELLQANGMLDHENTTEIPFQRDDLCVISSSTPFASRYLIYAL